MKWAGHWNFAPVGKLAFINWDHQIVRPSDWWNRTKLNFRRVGNLAKLLAPATSNKSARTIASAAATVNASAPQGLVREPHPENSWQKGKSCQNQVLTAFDFWLTQVAVYMTMIVAVPVIVT